MATNTIIRKRTLEWIILGIVLLYTAVIITLTVYLVKCKKNTNYNCNNEKQTCSKINQNEYTLEICCPKGKTPFIDSYGLKTQCN